MSNISGPLIDKIDIHIDVPVVTFSKLHSRANQLDSATIRAEVVRAREIRGKRFGDGKILTNARMSHKQVRKFCELDSASEMTLKQAITEFDLSAGADDKICKVARIIADLADSESI
jgi:magnesium chelatase family protein